MIYENRTPCPHCEGKNQLEIRGLLSLISGNLCVMGQSRSGTWGKQRPAAPAKLPTVPRPKLDPCVPLYLVPNAAQLPPRNSVVGLATAHLWTDLQFDPELHHDETHRLASPPPNCPSNREYNTKLFGGAVSSTGHLLRWAIPSNWAGSVAPPPKLTHRRFQMSTASASSSRSATRRLIKELDAWRVEAQDEKGIERLGPVSEDDLLAWEAVFNGRGISGGYEGNYHDKPTGPPPPRLPGPVFPKKITSININPPPFPKYVYVAHPKTDWVRNNPQQKAAGCSRSRSRPTTRCRRRRCAS